MDYNDYYRDLDANIAVAGSYWATWTLPYWLSDTYSVRNIRVTEVVFEDGTKWVGK